MPETMTSLVVAALLICCGADLLAETDPVLMPSEFAKSPASFSGTAATPPTPAMLSALAKTVKADLAETPLEDALARLSDQLKIPVILDKQALADVGLEPSTPVSLSIQGLPADQLLNLLLKPRSLGYVFCGDTLRVTTQDEADYAMYIQMHDVADLLPPTAADAIDADDLLDLLQASLPEAMWIDYDGEGGTAQVVNRVLVVRQNHRTHVELERFLSRLREIRQDRVQQAPAQKMPVVAYPVTTAHVTKSVQKEIWSLLPEELARVIRSSIEPDSWADPDKSEMGAIWIVPNAIVIRATPTVHAQVRQFLEPFAPPKEPEPIYGGGSGFGAAGDSGAGKVSGGAGFFSTSPVPNASP